MRNYQGVSRREGVGSLAAILASRAPYLGGGQGHRLEALLLVVPVGDGEGLHGLRRRVGVTRQEARAANQQRQQQLSQELNWQKGGGLVADGSLAPSPPRGRNHLRDQSASLSSHVWDLQHRQGH